MNKNRLLKEVKLFSKPLSTINSFNCKFLNENEIDLLKSFDIRIRVFYKFNNTNKEYNKLLTNKSFNKMINLINIIVICEDIYSILGFNNENSSYNLYDFNHIELICDIKDINKLVNKMILDDYNNKLNILCEGSRYFMNLLFYNIFDDEEINLLLDHNTYKISKINNLLSDHLYDKKELEKLFILLDDLQQKMHVFNILNIKLDENIFSYPYNQDDNINDVLDYIFNDFNSKISFLNRELVIINKLMKIFDIFALLFVLYFSLCFYLNNILIINDNDYHITPIINNNRYTIRYTSSNTYSETDYDIFNNRYVNILACLFFYFIVRIYSYFI